MKKENEDEKLRFIDPTSDYGFKAIFGNKGKTLFLRKALQALILSDIPIEHVFFDDKNLEGLTEDSRSSVLDISCVDERGNHFLIEMQLADFQFFMNRLKFYACGKLNEMVRRGKYKFDDLTRIYSIAILVKPIFEGKKYHRIGWIREDNGDTMSDQSQYIVVELEKFQLTESEVKTDLEKLLFMMKNFSEIRLEGAPKPDFFEEKWLTEAIEELESKVMTPQDYTRYQRLMVMRADEQRRQERDIRIAEADKRIKENREEQKKIRAEMKITKAESKETKAELRKSIAEKRKVEMEWKKMAAEKQKMATEKQKVEAEKQKAEAEKQKAEAEKQKAEAEKQKMLENAIFLLYEKRKMSFDEIAEIYPFTPKQIEKIVKKKAAENMDK